MTWLRWEGEGADLAHEISRSPSVEAALELAALPLLAGEAATVLAGVLAAAHRLGGLSREVRDLLEPLIPVVARELGPVRVGLGDEYPCCERWRIHSGNWLPLIALQYAAALELPCEVEVCYSATYDPDCRLVVPAEWSSRPSPIAHEAWLWRRRGLQRPYGPTREPIWVISRGWV